MQEIKLSEFPLSNDYDIVKISDVTFNLDQLKNLVENILSKQPAIGKDNSSTYLGLGLHYYDESNPYYNCVNYLTKDKPGLIYTTPNEFGKLFQFVYDLMPNYQFSRGRILIAKPGHMGNNHTDEQTALRLHIPITTNDKCIMHFGNNAYHMTNDGSMYIANTRKPHSFENLGDTDRIHIVFTIKDCGRHQP